MGSSDTSIAVSELIVKVLHFLVAAIMKSKSRKRSEALFDLLQEKYTKDLLFGIPNTFFVASDSMGSYQIT